MRQLQRFSVAIGGILCIAIWALSLFVFHARQGWPRGLWVLAGVVVFVGCAFAWKPKPNA